VLGEMEPARQRRAVLDRRCQVCDVELGDRRRPNGPWRRPLWLAAIRTPGVDEQGDVGTSVGGQTIRVGRRVVPLIFEPWCCEPCLRYALLVCPGMIHRRAPEAAGGPPLRLLRVRDAQPVVVTARITGDGPVAGQVLATYVKIAVLDADIVLPEAFLGHVSVAA
jgi:hypothetical protein